MIVQARKNYPHLSFVVGDLEDEKPIKSLPGPFDVILITDTLGAIDDCQHLFDNLHELCTRETRLIVGYFSHLWYPALKLAEALRLRMPQPAQTSYLRQTFAVWPHSPISSPSIRIRLLAPFRMLGLGRLINRFIAPFPLIRQSCLRHYSVFRPRRHVRESTLSATVVVPARNERGQHRSRGATDSALHRDLEIIFVEGHSQDGTWDEIERVVAAYPHYDIKAMRQPGKARPTRSLPPSTPRAADVLMILDADLTMPPEQLPKFWEAIQLRQGRIRQRLAARLSDGDEAMRFLNLSRTRCFR